MFDAKEMSKMTSISSHNREIQVNVDNWKRKPLLREIYKSFHETIASQLMNHNSGVVVELGSGAADITEVIPKCIRTDLFPNPWIDRIENAYDLSFQANSISNLIIFDVFHHLRYPGEALKEFHRVLVARGRVLIFEPCISLLGCLVYGLLHKEPIGYSEPIQWNAPANWSPKELDYYAAQGNATRIFLRREIDIAAFGWNIILTKRLCSISYVASGGYSKPQMYPTRALPIMQRIDKALERIPLIFGTRLLVVLEKVDSAEHQITEPLAEIAGPFKGQGVAIAPELPDKKND
ncbi:MAG: class I SAM-dependent methyltransferase [bacterium]